MKLFVFFLRGKVGAEEALSGEEITRVSPKLEGDVDTSSARESKSIAGRKDRVGNGTRARFTRKSGNRGSGSTRAHGR